MTKRMIFPLILGIAGVAVLLSLGTWQLDRLEWKEDILTRIEARMSADPVPLSSLPVPLVPEQQKYLKVSVAGYLTNTEAHILTSRKFIGPGYRVVSKLVISDNPEDAILVDLGFVPDTAKDATRLTGKVRLEGNLVWPDDYDPAFTPDPDLDKNIWFARHLPTLVAEMGVNPVLVVVDKAEIEVDGTYVPYTDTEFLPVTTNVKNDHLEYAITWFSLALVWIGMTLYLLWRIRQKTV